ncbi:MAG: hypothetical protein QOG05_5829 [Streptosporangiaceae bacterium]|nr:hypothetical protein [Streptosporangiaceae bacterium]
MIVRRGYSVPEHVTVAGAAAGTVALLYPFLMAHTGDRGVPCPLRSLTGVPCPCCGMTTATVSLVHGGWLAAARTSPAACLLGALVLSTAPLLLARLAGWMPPPRPWSAGARRRTGQVMAGLAAVSELFQLHRYGFL